MSRVGYNRHVALAQRYNFPASSISIFTQIYGGKKERVCFLADDYALFKHETIAQTPLLVKIEYPHYF
jgi:hypothetical protein